MADLLHPGLELVGQVELVEDSAVMTVPGLPNDRKYYAFIIMAQGTANGAPRLSINGLTGGTEFAYIQHILGTGDTSHIDQAHFGVANQTTTVDRTVINGKLIKLGDLDSYSAIYQTVAESSEDSGDTSVANMVIGKVEATEINSIDFFYSVGNVIAGSFIEIYASTSRKRL